MLAPLAGAIASLSSATIMRPTSSGARPAFRPGAAPTQHLSVDGPRAQADRRNAVSPPLDRDPFGQPDDSVLRHVVGDQARELFRRVHPRERRDGDDPPAPHASHAGERAPAAEEGSGEVDVQRAVPDPVCRLLERTWRVGRPRRRGRSARRSPRRPRTGARHRADPRRRPPPRARHRLVPERLRPPPRVPPRCGLRARPGPRPWRVRAPWTARSPGSPR